MYTWPRTAIFGCVTLSHDATSEKNDDKIKEKHSLKFQKNYDQPTNEPVNTCDTTAWVRGMSWCAKNQNCTHTHETHFGNTAGLPTPVLNATAGAYSLCREAGNHVCLPSSSQTLY